MLALGAAAYILEIPSGAKSISTAYDVAIAGGGLGSTALAKNMAEHGARVLVVEHERQFKDRVRGEVMFPWGYAEAQALGVADHLAAAGGHHLDWIDTYVASDRVEHREVVPSTKHQLPFLACYHPAMQASLLKAATAAGGHSAAGRRGSRGGARWAAGRPARDGD